MRLKTVEIKNFKAIRKATLGLADFNVIVGENGSGKSSVLQAMHWMLQSGRHKKVKPNAEGQGTTLPERDAIYMPSPNYLEAAHGAPYADSETQSQMDVTVTAEFNRGDKEEKAKMWIRAAHNGGLSVHVPPSNKIVAAMRNPSREFSVYIPGLVGLSSSEEKRSRMIVHRCAAAGDANAALRNILLLLKERKKGKGKESDFSRFKSFISEVMGNDLEFNVEFKEEEDFSIQAEFQTKSMRKANQGFKPLEFAGTGFLQIVQIFACLTCFKPVLLLVDEPDAHLHPPAQERLMKVLAEAAKRCKTQIAATTHSPSVMRGLPSDARAIWMEGGEVRKSGAYKAPRPTDWRLFDEKVLLITEDSKPSKLRALLGQWPEIERCVAVWPFAGHTTLLSPNIVDGLVKLTGGSLKAMLHRDRDFMMPEIVKKKSGAYGSKGHLFWVTKYSDIEAYWCDKEVIAEHFGVAEKKAEEIIKESAGNIFCIKEFRRKAKQSNASDKGENTIYGEGDLLKAACKHGFQHKVLGKDLIAEIRKTATTREDMKGKAAGFGAAVPKGMRGKMAVDLKEAIEKLL